MEQSKPEIRKAVIYRDSHGDEHPSFVTSVHGEGTTPLINLAYVTSDEKKTDSYGRAVLRATSVRHASERTPTGICWRFPDQELGPEPQPAPRTVRR